MLWLCIVFDTVHHPRYMTVVYHEKKIVVYLAIHEVFDILKLVLYKHLCTSHGYESH